MLAGAGGRGVNSFLLQRTAAALKEGALFCHNKPGVPRSCRSRACQDSTPNFKGAPVWNYRSTTPRPKSIRVFDV